MTKIINLIQAVKDRKDQPRNTRHITGIMIHRCGINLRSGAVIGYDANSICRAFSGRDPNWPEVAKATGGNNPYTFMVGGDLGREEYDGAIWQTLELGEIGWHALACSRSHLGIGAIGDFRMRMPSRRQWDSLVWLAAELSSFLRIPIFRVTGHGYVASAHGGTKGPGQIDACPGDLFLVDRFRNAVGSKMKQLDFISAKSRLLNAGMAF